MQPNRPITPSTLSVKDLPWQILWSKDKCTLCGRCTAVCPVHAIELGVFRKRIVQADIDPARRCDRNVRPMKIAVRIRSGTFSITSRGQDRSSVRRRGQ